MRPDLYWKRLVAAYRRRRARQSTVIRLEKAQLADELLDTLNPSVLLATGYLRRRRVYRRRITTTRVRPIYRIDT